MDQKIGDDGSGEGDIDSSFEANKRLKHKKKRFKTSLRKSAMDPNTDTISDSGISSQQQIVEKSNYLHFFELAPQDSHKLILSSSSTNAKKKEDAIISRPPLDFRTKVSSWLVQEDLHLSSPPPSPLLMTSFCPPPPPPPLAADPSALTNSKSDKVPFRHSSRKRIKPVEYWNNETVLYDDDGSLKAIEKDLTIIEVSRYQNTTMLHPKKRKMDSETTSIQKSSKKLKSPLKNKTKTKSKNTITLVNNEDKQISREGFELKNKSKSKMVNKDKGSQRTKTDFDKTEKMKLVDKLNRAKKAKTDLASTTLKPPAKRKNKLETIISQSNTNLTNLEESGIRRGGRTRIKPVAYWDSEFVRYDDHGNFLAIENVGATEDLEKTKNRYMSKKKSDSPVNNKTSDSTEKEKKDDLTFSSGLTISDSGNWKKRKQKKAKKINTTDLATKIIRRNSKGKNRKSTKDRKNEYPFNQLNKKSPFRLGGILEIIDKNGTILKVNPIEESEHFTSQEKANGKESTVILNEKANPSNNTIFGGQKVTAFTSGNQKEVSTALQETTLKEMDRGTWTMSRIKTLADKTIQSGTGTKKSPVKCPLCLLLITRGYNLQRHMINLHLNERIKEASITASAHVRQSRRSRIAPVEYWDSNYVHYNLDGTLIGVEPWTGKKTSKEATKKHAKVPATDNDGNGLMRRRLFAPAASSNSASSSSTNDKVSNSESETAPLSVRIQSYKEKDETSKRFKNVLVEGISELPLTPVAEVSSRLFDGSESGNTPLSDTSHKKKNVPKGQNKIVKKRPMTWLSKEVLSNMTIVECHDENIQKTSNNQDDGSSCNEDISNDITHDFEVPIENEMEISPEQQLKQNPKGIKSTKDHVVRRSSPRPNHKLTPYQVMQQEMEQHHLNTSINSQQQEAGTLVMTTISFLPQKVKPLPFNAVWASPASKKDITKYGVRHKNTDELFKESVLSKNECHKDPSQSITKSIEIHANSENSSEMLQKKSADTHACDEDSMQGNTCTLEEKLQTNVPMKNSSRDEDVNNNKSEDIITSNSTETNRDKDCNLEVNSTNTDRYEEVSPLVKTMHRISKYQRRRSLHFQSQKDSAAPSSLKEPCTSSSDATVHPSVGVSFTISGNASVPPYTDTNVPINPGASAPPSDDGHVAESFRDYVEASSDCHDIPLHSNASTVTQDEPEYSGDESADTNIKYEEKDNHEFYPIVDPENCGKNDASICYMAKSVDHPESGVYSAFISIKRGQKTWTVSEGSVVVVLEGSGSLRQTLNGETTVTELVADDVMNLAEGETVSLSLNSDKSDVPLLAMLVIGATSVEYPQLSEALEEQPDSD